MSMSTKNQYLHALITKSGGYHLKNKKHKSLILEEYCRTTGQNRQAVSAKIRSGKYVKSLRREKGEERRRRSSPLHQWDNRLSGEALEYIWPPLRPAFKANDKNWTAAISEIRWVVNFNWNDEKVKSRLGAHHWR